MLLRRRKLSIALAAAAVYLIGAAMIVNGASAEAYQYEYMGNQFSSVSGEYTTDDFVKSTLTFSQQLVDGYEYKWPEVDTILLDWSFSDGVQTLTSDDDGSYITTFTIRTYGNEISTWKLRAYGEHDPFWGDPYNLVAGRS